LRIVIEKDRKSCGFSDCCIVFEKFLFVRSNEEGRKDGDSTHTRFLCHLREGDGLSGGDGSCASIDGDSPSSLFNDNFDDPFFLLKCEGIKLSLTSNGKEAMDASIDQVAGELSESFYIDLPF
jgi:hypothetical protein